MSYNRAITEMFKEIGLTLQPGEHLPDAGMEPKDWNGHKVFIKAKPQRIVSTGYFGLVRRSPKHRVMVQCKHCTKIVSFGRIFQHLKRKDHQ